MSRFPFELLSHRLITPSALLSSGTQNPPLFTSLQSHPDQNCILSTLSCDLSWVPCSCPTPLIGLAPHSSQRGTSSAPNPPMLPISLGVKARDPLHSSPLQSDPCNFSDLNSHHPAPPSLPTTLASWQLFLHTKVLLLGSGIDYSLSLESVPCSINMAPCLFPFKSLLKCPFLRDFSISLLRDFL